MGCVSTIKYGKFPKQSSDVGKRVQVCYYYDTSKCDYGTIVRDDFEEPYETIIVLDDKRYLRGRECQYAFLE